MTTTDSTNHKGMNVIGLLWLFVNSSPIALMEQLKNCSINVPSKLEGVGIENPCKCLTYRDFLRRVPGGTRTHDIQNHNLTL